MYAFVYFNLLPFLEKITYFENVELIFLNTYNLTKVKLYIAFITEKYTKRTDVLYDSFGKYLANNSKVKFAWVNHELESHRAYNLPLPDIYKDITRLGRLRFCERSFDIMMKFHYACTVFMKMNIPWLFRATDDTFVNYNNIDAYLRYLDTLPDPYTNAIIEGNCVLYFLQGGSGYIMSRKAVEHYLNYYTVFKTVKNCIKYQPDDLKFPHFMNSYNITVKDATSFYYLGHDNFFYTLQNWSYHQYHNTLSEILPACPESLYSHPGDECGLFLAPIANIVFLHTYFDDRFKPIPQKLRLPYSTQRFKLYLNLTDLNVMFSFPNLSNPLLPYYCYDTSGTRHKSINELYPPK